MWTLDISLVSLVKNAGRQKESKQSLCFDHHLMMMLSVIWIWLLTIPPFPLLAISNGDILCFVKIPSFDGDIFSFAHSFPDMGRSHTTREGFFSIEIFICTPGHSSAVFLLCGAFVQYIGQKSLFAGNFIPHCLESWGLSMGTVAREWSDYSIQIAPFRTIFCTISYHFFCTRFKHCVPPHHTVHRDFTLKHCAHQCNVHKAVHGNRKYSHVKVIQFINVQFRSTALKQCKRLFCTTKTLSQCKLLFKVGFQVAGHLSLS